MSSNIFLHLKWISTNITFIFGFTSSFFDFQPRHELIVFLPFGFFWDYITVGLFLNIIFNFVISFVIKDIFYREIIIISPRLIVQLFAFILSFIFIMLIIFDIIVIFPLLMCDLEDSKFFFLINCNFQNFK